MIITVIEKSKTPHWHFICSDRFKLSKLRVRLGEYDFKKVMIVKAFVIWCLICSEFLCLPSYDWQWLSILKWLESRLKVSFFKNIFHLFIGKEGETGDETFAVAAMEIHEDYNPKTGNRHEHDIAVLKLARSATRSSLRLSTLCKYLLGLLQFRQYACPHQISNLRKDTP